jgi:phage replication-related protein YjqB (UPF0714/DUF867 family)
MAKDKYLNFESLRKCQREDIDFRRCIRDSMSALTIIAPHGGKIERRTSDIAHAIAGDALNLYCFEGTKSTGNKALHITSCNFDEPQCLDLIAKSDVVVAVHGLNRKGKSVDVGGRDSELRDEVCRQLRRAGFRANVVDSGVHAAISRENICNRGRSGKGVQLEITSDLRDSLSGPLLTKFSDAVREALGIT